MEDTVLQKQQNRDRSYISYMKQHYKEHGNLEDVSHKAKQYLDALVVRQREGTLDVELKKEYDKMKFDWKTHAEKEWEYYYNTAERYHRMFGTIEMPSVLEMNGVKLGEWIEQQKEAYKKGELSLRRAEKLQKLGIRMGHQSRDHVSYDESVLSYYVGQVFPDVIRSYEPACLNGKELDIYIPSLRTGIEFDGHWHKKSLNKDLEKNALCAANDIKLIRVRAKGLPAMCSTENCKVISAGKSNKTRVDEIKEVLETLGVSEFPSIDIKRDKADIFSIMIEDKTYFNQYLMAAKHYYQENGHLFVPKDYTDPTGMRLGQWIKEMRASKKYLSERQINALEERGMEWSPIKAKEWLYNFEKAKEYGGNIKDIPKYETTTDGKSLQSWFREQKQLYRNMEMTEKYRRKAMEALKDRTKTAVKNFDHKNHKTRKDREER